MEQEIVGEEVALEPQEQENASNSQVKTAEIPKPDNKAEELAQNYKIRAEKAERELKGFQKGNKGSLPTDGEWKNKVEFLIKNRDFNEEEFDHIAVVAAKKGIPLEEAAKIESDYIAFKRQKVKNENKTPSPSSATSIFSEKQISSNTPKEDIDKILKERFEKVKGGRDTGY